MSQIVLLLRLYISPLKTFSKIVDEGRLFFAVIAALAAVFALQMPRTVEYQRQAAETYSRILKEKRAQAASKAAEADVADETDEADEAPIPRLPFGTVSIPEAAERFTARSPSHYFPALLALALCFVPAAILIVTLWESIGAFSTILFRDYLALLVCTLLAWTAAYLPMALINGSLLYVHSPWFDHPALWAIAQVCFLALATCAIRTLMGTSFPHAAAAACGAAVAGVAGIAVYGVLGGVTSWLASPFILYYLYNGLAPEFRSLGVGLRSRQRFKTHLENATLNPRDAEAHYQLGLLYQQRRQNALAIEEFQKSVAIDPADPDAHFQLGRIARQEGRYDAAFEHCRAAARADDKHCSSEVWREIGVIDHLRGQAENARLALEKYLDRRPYDPEGQCWYGRTLIKLGLPDQAKAAFDQAIESVRTMPAARKRQVRAWESEARKELRTLKSTAPPALERAPAR